MSRPRFATVAWEVNQVRHELDQAARFDHDQKATCWCCCCDCSARGTDVTPLGAGPGKAARGAQRRELPRTVEGPNPCN